MFKEIRTRVSEILGKDNSGHNMEHIDRVLRLSLKFATTEKSNKKPTKTKSGKVQKPKLKDAGSPHKDIITLTALLHDVDDYKLFGFDNAKNLTNAKNILNQCYIDNDIQEQVLAAIQTIGYNKRLRGIMPTTIEAMLVSDADMCDGMGVTGILRSYQYKIAHGDKFFDKNVTPPHNISASSYEQESRPETVVTHMFEKMLRLKKSNAN